MIILAEKVMATSRVNSFSLDIGITTPLHWPAWELALYSHPDRIFADLIVNGIKEGYRIGFDYSYLPVTKSCINIQT